jgi:DNA-directed RNA polymerase specialized sigma24 family protein
VTTALETTGRAAHFEDLYRKHYRGIRAFAGQIVFSGDEDLAEDIVAEAFMHYWRSFVLTDKYLQRTQYTDRATFNLLATITRFKLSNHLARRWAGERPVDFTDQANRWYEARLIDHDASTTADQRDAELEAATDAMADACRAWKAARHRVSCIRAGIASAASRFGVDHVAQFTGAQAERIATAEEVQDAALEVFRARCEDVARIRTRNRNTPNPQ